VFLPTSEYFTGAGQSSPRCFRTLQRCSPPTGPAASRRLRSAIDPPRVRSHSFVVPFVQPLTLPFVQPLTPRDKRPIGPTLDAATVGTDRVGPLAEWMPRGYSRTGCFVSPVSDESRGSPYWSSAVVHGVSGYDCAPPWLLRATSSTVADRLPSWRSLDSS